MLPVVKPSWIDHSMEKRKQVNPRQYSPDPSLFMTDVLVTCAGIPEGDKEAIAGGLLAFGGLFSEDLTKQVTHIVALNMSNDKCYTAKAKNLGCKIVLPHWYAVDGPNSIQLLTSDRFDDCLRLRRRISEKPYELPDPEYLRNDSLLQSPISRNNSDIKGASDPTPQTLPEIITDATKRRPLKVFRNKKIMLSEDLLLGDNIKRILKELFEESGGSIVDNVRQADTYICRYREGDDYRTASQEGKVVGNMSWLYWLITHDTWTSPLRRLLHYPLPKGGIKGFDQFKISVSNYAGEARVYLEHLIRATGADFTRSMSHANTHLITALDAGDKSNAAREWNIEILNHLWIEESYAKCERQPMSRSAYQTFPPRTHLGEIVGQTSFDRDLLEKHFYRRSSAAFTSAPAAVGGCDEPRPDLEALSMVKPKTGISTLSLFDHLPSEGMDALQPVDNMDVDEPPPTLVQKGVRTVKETVVRTPAPCRVSEAGKENETPGTTGSRSAKDRALSRLHDAAADMALFEKEKKRVGGVTHGRERHSSHVKEKDSTPVKEIDEGDSPRKRKLVEVEQESSEEEEIKIAAGKASSRKKAKHEKLPPITHRMMITGLERWNEKPDLEQKERNKLRNLGIFVTDDPSHVTILLAPHILRTKKFVCAIASAPHVVGPSFLDACIKNDTVPDLKKHALHDGDGEERMGFKLLHGLERARSNGHALLKGWQIFCTEKVKGGFETYKEIVRANGGICTLWKGRTTLQVSRRSFAHIVTAADGVGGEGAEEHPAAKSQGDDKGDTLYLVSGTSKEEVALWGKFRMQASKADMLPVIAKTDWVLAVAMQQRIVWQDQWELREDLL